MTNNFLDDLTEGLNIKDIIENSINIVNLVTVTSPILTGGSCGAACNVGDDYCYGHCSNQCHDQGPCQTSDGCTYCVSGDCTSCANCDYCNNCDSCDSGCQSCDSCQGCNHCNTCQGCDGCDSCQGCDGCQICNSCQGFCETKQTISDRLGKFNYTTTELNTEEFSTSKTYTINSTVVYNKKLYKCIKAITSPGEWDASKWEECYVPAYNFDWSGLVDYLNRSAVLAKVTFPSKPASVSLGELLKNPQFNDVNAAINSFLDSVTGLDNKAAYDQLIASDLTIFRNTINGAKIATNIPCCEVSGHESCITRQA